MAPGEFTNISHIAKVGHCQAASADAGASVAMSGVSCMSVHPGGCQQWNKDVAGAYGTR